MAIKTLSHSHKRATQTLDTKSLFRSRDSRLLAWVVFMNVRGKELTTPNPRAVPSSAVKDVEESRQQRLQRQQSRFRDRGGYALSPFVLSPA